ncbi:UxaA family hydrolase [Paraburkholderia fungorum]|uniref:UxaA family hydrolase n=1 Tax=Paraburkholderia fungorum TaxID=134537 RepID=UPI0038B7181F
MHEAKDTVGVAVVEGIRAGTQLSAWIMDDDEIITVSAKQDIPIGHKVALRDMAVGETVYKYGVDIGKVVAPIKAGEHAHVHNIKTKRW